MAKKVSKEEFDSLTKEDKLVLVDFFATWCGPCQMMESVIEEIANDFEKDDKVEVVKVDIDEEPEIPAKYSVMSVPTFLFVKGGEEVDRVVGAMPKEMIEDKIKQHSEEKK